jgi:F-type H+-transporting ATPase subunit b
MQQFDLFTFIATIVNFIILVVLLRIFLYDRVLEAVRKRQEKIHAKWEDAEEEKRQAGEEKKRYARQAEELSEKEQAILKQTQLEAESRRKEILRDAKKEFEEKKEQWQRSLDRKEKSLTHVIRENITAEVVTLTKRIIGDLADADLQNKIAELFVRKLRNIDADEKAKIRQELQEGEKRIVNSSFALSREQKQNIRGALGLDKKAAIEFTKKEDRVLGLELVSGDKVYAWHVDDYLDRVEKNILQTARKGMG